jgi:hypothetical protein
VYIFFSPCVDDSSGAGGVFVEKKIEVKVERIGISFDKREE